MENIQYKTILPSSELRPYIKHYLYVNLDLTGKFKVISSPYVELFFLFKPVKITNKNGSLFHPKIFIGGFQELDNDNFSHMFKTNVRKGFVIVFNIHGFYRLFGLKPCEFANYLINGDDLSRSELSDLWGNLNDIEDSMEMKNATDKVFERFLVRASPGSQLVQHVFNIIKRNHGILRAAQLCKDLNISTRKLQRCMKDEIGISAKDLFQIIRFNYVMDNIHSIQFQKLTEISYLCGYFDQSHFIKDFKKVTGMTPKVISHMRKEGKLINVDDRNFISLDK